MPIIGRYVAVLNAVLLAFLAVFLLRRKMQRQTPFFVSYTVFSIISQIGNVLLYTHYTLYFQFFWASETVNTVLAFFSLYEVFRWVFRNFYGIVWFRYLFPIMGILMLLMAGIRSLLLPAPDVQRLITAIISLAIALNFLQVGIFALFFLLVSFFHMRRRQHAFGITLGFGIIAITNVTILLLRSEFGKKFEPVSQITPPIAYIIAVVVWLAAFIPPQPDHPLKDWVPPLTPEEMLVELSQYTRAVKGVLRR